jgi:hypothetical protein
MAIVMSLIGAFASLARGGHYVHEDVDPQVQQAEAEAETVSAT